jgi:hypothetical protein
MGWSGIDNGRLLREAKDAAFDALLSNDRGLEYGQDVANLPLSVVVLLAESNTLESIRPLLPALHLALDKLQPRQFVKISPA